MADALRAPKPGTKAHLERQLDEMRQQAARDAAELARLRAVAPAPSLTAPPLLRAIVPVLITSPLNGAQGNFMRAASKRKKLRELVTAMLRSASPYSDGFFLLRQHPRLSVHLERRAEKQLDHDNFAAGAKSAVDAVAAWLGTTDAPTGPLTVSYSQDAHKRYRNTPDLVIEIRSLP